MRFFLLVAFFSFSISIHASDYYWVGGNGNWSDYSTHWATSSNGITFHTQVPSPLDNVYFDNNSFSGASGTVSLNQTIIATNHLIFTTGTKVISLEGGTTASTLNIYGDLQFDAGVTMNYSGNLVFKSSGSTTSSITQKGATILSTTQFIFDAATKEWIVNDSLSVYTIHLLNGTINASGKKIICENFFSDNINTRNIDFTNTKVRVMGEWKVNTTNLTFTLTGSKIHCIDPGRFTSTPIAVNYDTLLVTKNFHASLDLSGNFNAKTVMAENVYSISFTGSIVIDKLLCHAEVVYKWNGTTHIKNSVFTNVKTFYIRDNLQLDNTNLSGTDCSSFMEVFGNPQGNLIKTSGTLNLNYAYLKNISATGGATFIATDIIDLGGNTGWTINLYPSSTMYWIGGTGNWTDASNWSYSSGGAPANCVPTAYNDALFDNNSFTANGEIVTIAYGAECKTIDFKSCNFNPTLKGGLNIYGSLLLKAGMNLVGFGGLSFYAPTNGNFIDFAGNSYTNNIEISCNGSYTLSDSLYAGVFYFNKGNLNTNGKKINCTSFYSNAFVTGPRTLTFGASEIIARQGVFDLSSSSLTLDAGVSVISVYGANTIRLGNNLIFHDFNAYGTFPYSVYGNNLQFNNAYFGNKGTITGSNVYDTLLVSSGYGISFRDNTTQTFNQITIKDPSCAFTEFSSEGTSPVNFVKTSGTLNLENVSLKLIHASGGASFNATNAVDLGGNTGWNLESAGIDDLYWIGGAGNWTDPMHWSLSSGGSSAGCSPSPNSNVKFDANSFTSDGETVTINASSITCRSMTWEDLSFPVNLSGTNLNILGSLVLHEKLSVQLFNIYIKNEEPAIIRTSAVRLPYVFLNGTDSVTFQDTFNASSLFLEKGSINFNKNDFYCDALSIGSGKKIKVYLDSSSIVVLGQLNIYKDSLELSAQGSVINVNEGYLNDTHIMVDQLSFDTIYTVTLNKVRIIKCTDNFSSTTTYLNGSDFTINTLEIDSINSFESSTYQMTVNEFSSYSNSCKLGGTYNTLKKAEFSSTETILTDNFNFDYLKISPGRTLKIQSGSTLVISTLLEAPGQPGFPIFISSAQSGSQATLSIPSGNFCYDFLFLSDIHASGGATYIAGLNSSDVSNNTGWDFTSPCELYYASYSSPVCEGSPIQLTSTEVTAGSYSWSGPDNFTSTDKDPLIANATQYHSGMYQVTAGGRIAQVNVNIVRSPANQIYLKDNFLYHVENNPSFIYIWYKDNILTQETGHAIRADNPGSFKLYVESPEGCSTFTNTIVIAPEVASPLLSPDNLIATAVSTSAIDLLWQDNANNESEFIIERSTDMLSGFTFLIRLGANTVSHTDSPLLPNSTYYYRVRAANAASSSLHSNTAGATTLDITSIYKNQEYYFDVYPNPTTGKLFVKWIQPNEEAMVKLYSDKGVLLLSKEYNVSSPLTEIDMGSLNKGIYMVQVLIGSKVQYRKVVVE